MPFQSHQNYISLKAISPTLYKVSLTLPRSLHFSASPAYCTEGQKQQSTDEKQESKDGDGRAVGAEAVGHRCDRNTDDQQNHAEGKGTPRAGPPRPSGGHVQLCSINRGWSFRREKIIAHRSVSVQLKQMRW